MPKFAMPLITALAKERPVPSSSNGFTLVELAIVLIIVGLLLSSLVSPLTAQIDQRNYNETEQQITEIREALIGFAVTNGRLPRPSTSVSDGAENPAACADDAACTGFIPWTTLGVKRTDAWNKMVRYSVSPSYANATFSLTTQGSKKIQTRDNAGAISYLIGSAAACSASSPCSPAVIYSAGKNNWGVANDGTAIADTSTTNADEDVNETAASVFFSRNQSTVPTGGEFDDIVVWIPPYVLMNRMVSAGKLP